MIALLLACAGPSPLPAPQPTPLPTVTPEPVPASPGRCDGFTTSAVRLGGEIADELETETGRVLAIGAGVWEQPDSGAARWRGLPGESRGLAGSTNELWVAAGTAGLLRVRGEQITRWETGGRIAAVLMHHGAIWAADETGRVLRLPLDASPNAAPDTRVVDGWPLRLRPEGDSVRVDARLDQDLRVWWSDGFQVTDAPAEEWPLAAPKGSSSIREIAPAAGGLAVGLTNTDNDGSVLLLQPDPTHPLVVTRRIDVDGGVSTLLADGDGVLTGLQGHGLVRIGPDWRTARPVALAGDRLNHLVRVDEDHLVAAAFGGGLVWFSRTDAGWATSRRVGLQSDTYPQAVLVDGARTGVVPSFHGYIDWWRGGARQDTEVLSGTLRSGEQLSRPRVLDGVLWAPLPGKGLERIDLSAGTGQVLRAPFGAWDVTPWDGGLLVALGEAGMGWVADPEAPTLEMVCDLPGVVRRVAVVDGQPVAATGGVLFSLRPRRMPP